MPRIALLQMVSSQDVPTSLKAAEQLILAAAKENVDGIFLPENFAALGNANPHGIGLAEATVDGPIRSFLASISKQTSTWIFAGTMPMAVRGDGSVVPDQRVRAASLVYDQNGVEVARYDKIHMFDVDVEDNHKRYRESDTFEPGDALSVCDSPCGFVGLSVCYDIRFPEVYRALRDAGSEVIAIPSAFTETTGEAHFEVLMRARAIETASYTVAACQGGIHDSGRRTHGASMVVGPWGDVIAKAGKGEAVIVADIDLSILAQIRADMPVHLQRKL